MHQQAAAHAAEAAASVSASTSSQSPFLPPDQLLMHRQLTLEAQREFLLRRGAAAFSPRHPFISGQVDVHPELQGRLPFHEGGAPNRYVMAIFILYQVQY